MLAAQSRKPRLCSQRSAIAVSGPDITVPAAGAGEGPGGCCERLEHTDIRNVMSI